MKEHLPECIGRTTLAAAALLSASEKISPPLASAQDLPSGHVLEIENPTLEQGLADLGLSLLETSFEAAHRRISQNLKDLVEKERFCGSIGGGVINCYLNNYEIDPNEVEEYINNPDQTIFNTFRILPNARGEPALIAITGGPGGLKPEVGNIESLEVAVQRLNRIDPDMMDFITSPDGYGLKIFAGSNIPSLIRRFTIRPADATFSPATKEIFLNEELPNSRREPISIIVTLLVESRHMSWEYVEDRLDDNPGVDKGLKLIEWVEQHRGVLSASEYRYAISDGRNIVDYYQQNPQLAG